MSLVFHVDMEITNSNVPHSLSLINATENPKPRYLVCETVCYR